MIILGIDPGIARMGYAVIKVVGDKLCALSFGCLETEKKIGREKRLLTLSKDLEKLIRKHKPNYLSLEQLFFFKNSKTAFLVGESQGIVLLESAKNKIPVIEVTPLQVKQALTGYGLATKEQIQKMVKTIFQLKEIPKPDDVADALAIAYCASRFINWNSKNKRKC
jgi:crossover junction endodeoxyribonuclease RuvC